MQRPFGPRWAALGVRALLRDDDVLHEGDWERITVYLDGNEAASVAFYRHSTNTFRSWSKVEKDGTHPVAYSAIGSHASLPSADFGFLDVGDRDGPRWQTYDDLAPVVDEPWVWVGGVGPPRKGARLHGTARARRALEAPRSTAGRQLAPTRLKTRARSLRVDASAALSSLAGRRLVPVCGPRAGGGRAASPCLCLAQASCRRTNAEGLDALPSAREHLRPER